MKSGAIHIARAPEILHVSLPCSGPTGVHHLLPGDCKSVSCNTIRILNPTLSPNLLGLRRNLSMTIRRHKGARLLTSHCASV
ncbi:hypothetical protein GDO81_006918 [Engystomops pustulosus]|uniref:Uncharacterized protein n=1 Tax=Engystomops pustulosus TaxID=76066 RepID=A0AAV7D066_ENGPU|nr:hypothetical protein GDO81_006918 [Engystomops pustulosus]